ncbi:hypothetical protein FGIG_09287 [Fasciola gigantica]|uniref:Uncharacterized protein n=1 Tax=Fasciola gigantica TaxID=46835 RepID=A0A504Y9Q6_FASGI|nr:hypothetical protein FGIG_09287 [Fasciola gigantica]
MGLKPTGANNTIAQRDNPKVAVASAPNITSGGRLTTNTVATSATSVTSTVPTPSGGLSVGSVMGGSGGASRWRTTSEHYDVSKSRTDETHGGANPKGSAGDLAYLDDATDEANQRLVNLTTERPRQAGRRLPSKFNRPGSPSNDDSSPNGYNENEANQARDFRVTQSEYSTSVTLVL